jgi:hypothetical protein
MMRAAAKAMLIAAQAKVPLARATADNPVDDTNTGRRPAGVRGLSRPSDSNLRRAAK